MRDDRKELNKQIETVLWFGVGVLILHLYVELHQFFADAGLSHPFADTLLGRIVKQASFFATPWSLKILSGACIAMYGIANRGVKSTSITTRSVVTSLIIGLIAWVGGTLLLTLDGVLNLLGVTGVSLVYLLSVVVGFMYIIKGTQGLNRLISFAPEKDIFNSENETFPQEERKIENEYSVNLPTQYIYKGQIRHGWINIVNPFRGLLIGGTTGSGKTYTFINSVIRQHISKGYTMYVYDFKFPNLTLKTYNAVLRHKAKLPKGTRFYCINLDDPERSHRSNPIARAYLNHIEDAYESAKTVLLNLNKNYITKQGDFFVESAINYATAVMWYLRDYDNGKYCTFAHFLELLGRNYRQVIPILMTNPYLETYMRPYASAYEGGAMDQVEGQVGSPQIALARLSSPNVYWVTSGNDFTLDINKPSEPKIVCVGNNDNRRDIYGAVLGLYNSRVIRLINQKGKLKSSVVVDELPTIYFRGLDNLISTARENQVAVTVGIQDFSTLERDYGKQEAEVIKNTMGSVITGQVKGASADAMQNLLGRNVQRKQSISLQTDDTVHGIQTELNYMAPASKIAQLSQGQFVGVVADNVGEESNLKAFNAKVLIDDKDLIQEQKIKELPKFSIFAEGDNSLEAQIQANYLAIKADIEQIIQDETKNVNSLIAKSTRK